MARQLLQRVLVLPQVPVGVDAAGEARRLVVAAANAMSWRAFCAVARGEVGDLDLVLEAGLAQEVGVVAAVQHHSHEVGATVLGHVQVEQVEQVLVEPRGRLHVHELRALAEVAGRDRRERGRRGFALPAEPDSRHACTVSARGPADEARCDLDAR